MVVSNAKERWKQTDSMNVDVVDGRVFGNLGTEVNQPQKARLIRLGELPVEFLLVPNDQKDQHSTIKTFDM